jgi:hypothetical protein
MTLRIVKSTVNVEAVCTVEEAMPLLEFLQANAAARINLRACTHIHAAALQVLLATAAKITALPDDEFLKRWLTPVLGHRVVKGK